MRSQQKLLRSVHKLELIDRRISWPDGCPCLACIVRFVRADLSTRKKNVRVSRMANYRAKGCGGQRCQAGARDVRPFPATAHRTPESATAIPAEAKVHNQRIVGVDIHARAYGFRKD